MHAKKHTHPHPEDSEYWAATCRVEVKRSVVSWWKVDGVRGDESGIAGTLRTRTPRDWDLQPL